MKSVYDFLYDISFVTLNHICLLLEVFWSHVIVVLLLLLLIHGISLQNEPPFATLTRTKGEHQTKKNTFSLKTFLDD